MLEGARRRFAVAAAEVSHQERWQRATLGMAVVAASAGHAVDVLDRVERFICSWPEVELIEVERKWLEDA